MTCKRSPDVHNDLQEVISGTDNDILCHMSTILTS